MRKIKVSSFGFVVGVAVMLTVVGCSLFKSSTSVQRAAYTTIATVEQTASTALDVYYGLVIKGLVKTNDLTVISQKFDQLQKACTIAAAIAQTGTNAIAPASINLQLTDLLSTVTASETSTNK
jgi:tRNA U34 5-methylaminomethyl-2-thiouridine-forming methyltransferase MnmC